MSSNAFADLARGVDLTAASLRDLLNENQAPAPGSPADKEADGEPYAGEWGDHPSRDIFATIMLASWSCADHLRGLAALLQAQCSIAALYTLARGAAEAAVLPCYLTEVGIEPLERVRRNMNCNLEGICQDLNMLRRLASPRPRRRSHGTRPSSGQSSAPGSGTGLPSRRRTGSGRPTSATSPSRQ